MDEKISPQQNTAGGIPAVVSSLKHTLGEAGLFRGGKALLHLNQKQGFDCPGCAWPDPDDKRSMAEFCENGAKAIAEESTQRRVTPEFFTLFSVADMLEKSEYWLGKQGRITHPMYLEAGGTHYKPIAWQDAFAKIATHLAQLSDPNQATFYTSGRTSNEAAFLYQFFVRAFGTNNLPDCSNMCHESSGTALIEALGFGKGTVTLEDFDHADGIIVIGQNPGTNHPRMLSSLQKAARRGCKIITINPLQEAGLNRFKHPQEIGALFGQGTQLTSLFLPVRINGDVALLKGIMKEMLSSEEAAPGTVFDHSFIQKYTVGYEAFSDDLRSTDWGLITRASGLTRAQIQEAAQLIQSRRRLIICWAMGLTQHKNAVANIQEAVNLLLLGGHLGRQGAGACPVRGHSNVQGDRTMGIWEKMPESFLQRLGAEFNFDPPRAHGLDTVASIKAMHAEQVKVFIGLGGNFLSATPDTEYVAAALQKCALTVHIATKLNRSHLITGKEALLLPCLGRTERDLQNGKAQFVTVENSMGIVHTSEGSLKPASADLKSEVAIVAGIAQALFTMKPERYPQVDWQQLVSDYDQIRTHIARVVPGFADFNLKVRKPEGFYLPHPVRDGLVFRTPSQKAHFTVHPIEPWELAPGSYLLMTIRSHDQFNTTIYGLDDRYRGIHNGRRVLFMNPDDIVVAGFKDGDRVNIASHFQGQTRQVENFRLVPYAIPSGCLAAYFPETNPLVALDNTARKSNTPVYKSLVVTLQAAIS